MAAGVPLSRASSLPQVFSVPGPLVSGNSPAWLTHCRPLLWRGSLLPLGCAAAPEIGLRGGPGGLWPTWLGLLRSPAGASSLATCFVVAEHIPLWERACSRWGQVRYISGGWCTAIASKLAPTGFLGAWSIGVRKFTCLADPPPAALVARELAPAGLRSGPWNWPARWAWWILANLVGAASQPSGSKLPRHGSGWAHSPVGASLLAMGSGQAISMAAGVPLSRASSLPQVFSVPGPLVSGNSPAWLTHRRPLLWRGSLLPLGCAAAPGIGLRGGSGGLWSAWLGLLRSPAGASSLATCFVVAEHIPLWERACSRWGQVRQYRWRLVYRYREQARSHRFARCLVHWCQEIHLLG